MIYCVPTNHCDAFPEIPSPAPSPSARGGLDRAAWASTLARAAADGHGVSLAHKFGAIGGQVIPMGASRAVGLRADLNSEEGLVKREERENMRVDGQWAVVGCWGL